VADVDTDAADLTLSGVSGNTALVPDANLVFPPLAGSWWMATSTRAM
jgi:hypothetical protein